MLTVWQVILQLSYGIPCLTLYILILIIFLKSSSKISFKSSFFKISIVLGFVDLFCFIVTWGWLKGPSFILTSHFYIGTESFFLHPIGAFLNYYLVGVRYYLLIISSANRVTAVLIPSKHEKIWSKFGIFIVCICFLIPFSLNFHILFGKTNIFPDPPVVGIDVKAAWFPISRALLNAIQSVLTAFLTFIFNALTLFMIRTRNRTGKKLVVNKVEAGLILICCWDFCTNLIFAANQTILYNLPNKSAPIYLGLRESVAWIYDMNNLSRPLFFITICKPVRTHLKLLFFKAKYARIDASRSRINFITIS